MGLTIDLTEEEAMKRLTTRRICTKCKEIYPTFYDAGMREMRWRTRNSFR